MSIQKQSDRDTSLPIMALALAATGTVALVDALIRRMRHRQATSTNDAASVMVRRRSSGEYYCDPDILPVLAPSTLKWMLDASVPSSYTFPDCGAITFSQGGHNFTPAQRENGDERVVTLIDHHHTGGEFKYTVHLEGPGNPKIDPSVHNHDGFLPPRPILDKCLDALFGYPDRH